MSYYYTYYIGYRTKGKIYPLGPYDCFGNLRPVLNRSRRFASDLYEDFISVSEAEISEELRKEFESEDWNGKKVVPVKYLPIKDLPIGDYIKKGYVLISEVIENEASEDNFDGFSTVISPTVYAAKLDHEMKFGKNPTETDEFGNAYHEPNASEYMYYMWPDYLCKAYESSIIRDYFETLKNYHMPEDCEYVVLETEG